MMPPWWRRRSRDIRIQRWRGAGGAPKGCSPVDALGCPPGRPGAGDAADVGLNLAVTGSLSALLWWQAARTAGASPSVRRYGLVGLVATAAAIAAAVAATALLAPGGL